MKRKVPLSRVSRIPRVNRQRKSKNWIRAYGSEQRVEFVRSLGCSVCGAIPSENAHIVTGGVGRKADAKSIVPLCGRRSTFELAFVGHHGLLHEWGRETFQRFFNINLAKAARETESAWRAHLAEDAA
jgi:hypothetical protein